MTVSKSLHEIYRAAGDMSRHHIDDVAGHGCVERLRRFGGERPVTPHGPLLAFAAIAPGPPDPAAAARIAAASGQPLALLVAVHHAMPGLGGGDPPVDVAELTWEPGRPAYWFAASPDRRRMLGGEAPVLLPGRDGAPDVAIAMASLRAAFATAAADRSPRLNGPLRDLVAAARDRLLAALYPEAILAALSARQALLSEATSGVHARQLAARGAPPLVPLRVAREDLLGKASGPVARMVTDYDWTVRQPVPAGSDDRIAHFAEGREGITLLARTFGDRPTRLLCFDAGRLEFDAVRSAGVRRPAGVAGAVDPMRAAISLSATREAAVVARQVTARVFIDRSASRARG